MNLKETLSKVNPSKLVDILVSIYEATLHIGFRTGKNNLNHQYLIKRTCAFFILFIPLFLMSPIRGTNEISFLYNGSEIQDAISSTQRFSYNPAEEHKKLQKEAAKEDDKNVAAFSLTYFTGFRQADEYRYEVDTSFTPKIYTQSFVKGKSTYDHALGRLYEHNAHHKKNQDNVVKSMFCPSCKDISCADHNGNQEESKTNHGPKSHVQALHHSEQWVLIDVRDHIKDYIFSILRARPNIEKIYGICLNIYSTNDPCKWCGETIEKVIPIIKADALGFLCNGGPSLLPQNPGDFKFFATVSSSNRYDQHSYRSRPNHMILEKLSHYKEFYNAHSSVRDKAPEFKDIDRKVLYFWTPSTSHKSYTALRLNFKRLETPRPLTFNSEEPYLDLSVVEKSQPNSVLPEFQKLLSKGYSNLITLNLSNAGIEFEEEYNFSSYTILHTLILSKNSFNTNLTFPQNLVELDLSEALLTYKDKCASKETKDKWKLRQYLFTTLGSQKSLRMLNLRGNNISVDEFEFLIAKKKSLVSIEKIDVSNNCIFSIKEKYIDEVMNLWCTFMSAKKTLKEIDVTSNGRPNSKFYEKFGNEEKLILD